VLIDNAGTTHRSKILETSPDIDRRILEVNYFGQIA
jgi:short-subunit dehydrogenase